MVSGTIRYTEQDFVLSQAAYLPGRMISLWQGACAIACLGAVIGYGIATLLSEMLAQTLPTLSQYTAWGAVCGAILLVGAGAQRLSTKLSPAQQAALQLQQAFLLDENGLRLSTDTAETRMNWSHFLDARIEPDLMILKTMDGTIVLLRSTFVADQSGWSEAKRIVSSRVPIAPDIQPLS